MANTITSDIGYDCRHLQIFIRCWLNSYPRVGKLCSRYRFYAGFSLTLQRGGHVRVDIFYREFSPRRKAAVDLIGTIIFLLPFCGLILFSSWDYVMASWAIKETSSETGGIAAVYLLKTLMIIMPITLGLQGIAQIISSILVLAKANENIAESKNG